jgi:phosphonate transport system substrate-binding protein
MVLACAPLCASSQVSEASEFRIGKVTLNPAKQEKEIAPMAGFLSQQLGYNEAGTVYTKDIDDMVELFARDEVEFFTGSFWEAAVLINEGVGEAVAIKFKRQSPIYRSLIVVHRDSEIEEISDLAGKLIAFEDPDSTSAYRVPYLQMRKAGLEMVENIRRPEHDSLVHYRFSNSEQISSAWLYRGIVDAISISDSDWSKADNVPSFQKEQYKIIYTSDELPRAVEVVRRNMPPENKQKLRNILFDPNLPENQADILDNYHETSGFIAPDPDTIKELENFSRYFTK